MTNIFEQTDLYQKSVAWTKRAETLLAALDRRTSAAVLDNFTRRSASIPSHIAAASDREQAHEQRHFLLNARAAVLECTYLVYLIKRQGLMSAEAVASLYSGLEELARILAHLVAVGPAEAVPQEAGY